MNKRIVLWIVFLMSILLLWDNWQRFNGKASMWFPGHNLNQVVKSDAPKMIQSGSANPVGATGVLQGSLPAETSATALPIASEIITITTDVFKAEIDTLGGEIRHLELLKEKEDSDASFGSGWKSLLFPGDAHKTVPNIVLFDRSAKHTYLAQSGLLGNYPNHKSLFVAKPAVYTSDATGQIHIVLEAVKNGVKLIKTYTFNKSSYSIGFSHQIVNESAAPLTPSLYMQLVRDGSKLEGESSFYSTFTGPAVYTETEKFQKLDFEKINKGSQSFATQADNGWFAMIQHYFVSGIIPQDKIPREIFARKVDNNLYAVGNVMALEPLAPGASKTVNAQIYTGPLVTSLLDKVAPGFNLVKDYGWTTIVAKPVFWLMDEIHKLLGNWGWTIIVLTIIIKIAFFPLSAASFRSMGKMKLLTPKMAEIRERHKDDPQKMNQAMMALYKTEKVNPLGGCLPLLIQTPVFMALYSVVLASVELRNAPWLGWIHDLSTPDPFLILPVLMAVSMFIQTKLNPAPADPMQAKMMMLMPLVFSVMFFFFPSGLVLYWVVNNVLSIAQQWVITRQMANAK
ncbi:MAG: yidC [Solimicrobium sp.]|nr:yidC [Solimicrobium sp.]